MKHSGLSSVEVQRSREEHGANVLTPPPRDPWWKQFLEKFDDPVIRILMIAAVIAIAAGAYDGQFVEGIGIIIAVLLATGLAFFNEFKANKEFDILNKVNDDVPIKVVREGVITTVPKRDLVVGDIVLLEVGEEVPADGDCLESVSLEVDQSKLTGESVAVHKGPEPDSEGGDGPYGANRLMRGTMVADGHGVMRVTAVGDRTEIGQAAKTASEETGEETPLNRQLEGLSKLIGVVGLGVAGVTFVALIARGVINGSLVLSREQWYFAATLFLAVGIALVRVWLPIVFDGLGLAGREVKQPAWLEKEGFGPWFTALWVAVVTWAALLVVGKFAGGLTGTPAAWLAPEALRHFLDFFMIAVTIIVVAVPEGLAMSVTLSLAYSMRKMTAANNLVRRMHACETIGAASVICSDKTGTLTMNQMRLHEMNLPWETAAPGAGPSEARLFVESMCANSTGNLGRKGGEPELIGNPTECALLLWLHERGVDYLGHRGAFRVERQWAFSTERKFMVTAGRSAVTEERVVFVKGAPEIVLDRCTRRAHGAGEHPLEEGHRASLRDEMREYQSRGMRTLGFAWSRGISHQLPDEASEAARDLTWIGFASIHDPIREEVPEAIKACREAGIEVKIVTGDNSETALEIGRQIGLVGGAGPAAHRCHHMTGAEFAALDEEGAREAAHHVRVLSRARPKDKLRLVQQLSARDVVVAVTGDGTNDAPALNYAHVGLSMGKTGTAVAKEASDIVLLDDSFRSIVSAVKWGRSLYQNIQRFIVFQLTINVAALVIAMVGPFIGVEIPLTVVQMLWINLIMDTFAALALATEPAHEEVMGASPRKPSDFIVTRTMSFWIFGVGAAFVAILLGLLLSMKGGGSVTEYELTFFYTVFVMLQFWNLFNARRLASCESALAGLTDNPLFLMIAGAILVGQIVIVNFGGGVFRAVPLALEDWIKIMASTSLVLWAGEALRWFGRLRRRSRIRVAMAPTPI